MTANPKQYAIIAEGMAFYGFIRLAIKDTAIRQNSHPITYPPHNMMLGDFDLATPQQFTHFGRVLAAHLSNPCISGDQREIFLRSLLENIGPMSSARVLERIDRRVLVCDEVDRGDESAQGG